MNKKVVVLGGGNGMSTLLRGLKQFPIDLTAIVSVCDDGGSTGGLRKEFNTPAVGDIRRVLISLSETEPLFEKMFNYRFQTDGYLNGHAVGNFLLQSMANITGSMSDGIEALGKVLTDGTIVEGEHFITETGKKIKKVYYKENPQITPEAIESIKTADLIILSMGSLYTSIIPNLISPEVKEAMDLSNAKIMYVCNIVTQPGETDDFTVSDHIKVLNEYLGKRKVDVVIVNDGHIDVDIAEKYQTLEQKDPVIFDKKEVEKLGVQIISDNLIKIEDDMLRHDVIKVALNIFTFLL